jgi:hypothetical protein
VVPGQAELVFVMGITFLSVFDASTHGHISLARFPMRQPIAINFFLMLSGAIDAEKPH